MFTVCRCIYTKTLFHLPLDSFSFNAQCSMHIRTVEWTEFEIESEDLRRAYRMGICIFCLFALTLMWRARATRKLPSGLCLCWKLTNSDKQFKMLLLLGWFVTSPHAVPPYEMFTGNMKNRRRWTRLFSFDRIRINKWHQQSHSANSARPAHTHTRTQCWRVPCTSVENTDDEWK